MPKQAVIKVKTEILVPYDRTKFGAASEAESTVTKIQDAIGEAMNGSKAISTKWSAEHANIETPEASQQAAE